MPSKGMKNLRVEVPAELVDALDEVARANNLSRTRVVVALLNDAMAPILGRVAVNALSSDAFKGNGRVQS